MQECHLSPGDTLALYTDGVTESVNDSGEEFGELRLVEALRRHRDQSPGAFVRHIIVLPEIGLSLTQYPLSPRVCSWFVFQKSRLDRPELGCPHCP
jgi:hypothetical protein